MHTQEAGLIIGLILGKYFFKTEDLHYGLWEEGMDVCVDNMAQAQQNHSKLIISAIPEGTETVLDVGCGVGVMASRLLDKGYKVDCVSPSPMLTDWARKRLGDRVSYFESGYEEVKTEKRYDLIMFSESFQYIDLKSAFDKSKELLNENGRILICDFFHKEESGRGALGGGHKLKKFRRMLGESCFKTEIDTDVTEKAAPNLDLVNEMMNEVGKPVWDMILLALEGNRPLLSKILRWKYKKKIAKIEQRYFQGDRNGENFKKHKSYRLLLLDR